MFRCDAGPGLGAGHAYRCLAVAEAFRSLGWRCTVATRPGTLEAVPALGRLAQLRLTGDEGAEARDLAAVAAELLVVDHYGRDARFEAACRVSGRRILAFDDAPARRHDCDALVDATPGRREVDYAGLLPDTASLLLGPVYAPLRAQFAAARRRAVSRRGAGPVERVLINFGGADVGGTTLPALRAAARALPDAAIDVVVGAAAPGLAALRDAAARLGGRCRVHVDTPEMAELMTAADLAVGAPGGAAWERCTLGLPTLLLTVADNQRDNARALRAFGAAEDCGPAAACSEDALAAPIAVLAGDGPRRARMAAAAAALCDGRGARRIAVALLGPRPARDGRPVTLRLASEADGDRLLAWQREPGARTFARNPETPDAAAHAAWFEERLADPGCWPLIIEHDGLPVGTLRLDRVARSGVPAFEVSILVGAAHRGRGIAAAALSLARSLARGADLLAEVLAGNEASFALFRAAGYEEIASGRFLSRGAVR